MRVAEVSLFDTFSKYDRIRQKDIERFTQELASGKKILKPSDNSVDMVHSLRLKSLQSDLKTFDRNTDMIRSTQIVAESTMGTVVETGMDVRPEIIQLLNTGVLDNEDAQAIKEYLQSSRDYILNQANARVGESRLFGGVRSGADPFAADGSYNGETTETTAAVSKGVELNTTFNGEKYFGVNANSNKMAVIEVLDQIISIIDSGDLTQLHTATLDVDVNGKNYGNVGLLDAFDAGYNAIMQQRSVIGSQINVADDVKQQNQTLELNYADLVSKLEDADYAGAITNLQKTQTAYEALLATFNQNKGLSLLNYFK